MKRLFYFILPILFFSFLFAPITPANADELTTYGVKLSKEYEFTVDPNLVWKTTAASVISNDDQILIAYDEGAKKAKENKNTFVISYYKPKLYEIKDKKTRLIWTGPKLNDLENAIAFGSLGNEPASAVYVFYPGKMDQYKYNGKKMIKKSFVLPVKYYIKQAVIGDIDNDGINEIVAFASDKNAKYAQQEKLSLLVYKCKFDNKDKEKEKEKYKDKDRDKETEEEKENTKEKHEFNIIYFGAFSYSGGDYPDKILGVKDIYNNGENKLLIMFGAQNASPAQYKVLSYKNDKMYKEKVFDQSNNVSALDLDNTAYNPDWFNKLLNELYLLKYNGKNYFLTKMLPQTAAASTSIAINEITEKRIIINAELRLARISGASIILPINIAGLSPNSCILQLDENGKAVIYKVDAIE